MKTVRQLMLKDLPLHHIRLNSKKSKDEWTIGNLMDYTNSVDMVVKRWSEAVAEHLEFPENIVAEILGSLVVTRLLIDDLKVLVQNPSADCISLLDGTQIITDLKQKMLPMSKSYARVPSLAQWYMSLPNEIDVVYRSIRRRLKDGQ
jgi:hypothetical protein